MAWGFLEATHPEVVYQFGRLRMAALHQSVPGSLKSQCELHYFPTLRVSLCSSDCSYLDAIEIKR